MRKIKLHRCFSQAEIDGAIDTFRRFLFDDASNEELVAGMEGFAYILRGSQATAAQRTIIAALESEAHMRMALGRMHDEIERDHKRAVDAVNYLAWGMQRINRRIQQRLGCPPDVQDILKSISDRATF